MFVEVFMLLVVLMMFSFEYFAPVKEIVWEFHLQNDLYYVKCDVKPTQLNWMDNSTWLTRQIIQLSTVFCAITKSNSK